jgi:hypothetical protein
MPRPAAPREIIMYVQVDSIPRHGLSADQMIDATILAMTELAVAEALILVHGTRRGIERYQERGGCVRWTPWGMVFVPVFAPKRRRRSSDPNAGRCHGPGGCFPDEPCPYRADDCAAR